VAMRVDAIDDQWIRKQGLSIHRRMRVEQQGGAVTAGRGNAKGIRGKEKRENPEGLLGPATVNWRLQYVQKFFRVHPAARIDRRAADKKQLTEDSNIDLASSRGGAKQGSSLPDSDATYHWIGIEEDRGHVWWFFEIAPKSKLPPEVLENRILFEKETNQINRVIVLGMNPRRSLVHSSENPRRPLFPKNQKTDEQ
ncbi:MAG: DUF6702 family protein, partial [Planctomycetota bacterium]|nr:DUF6702 family protein [Planctomycetota bacterium]